MPTHIDKINGILAHLGLDGGEAYARPVRENANLLVLDMRHGYHVCENPAGVLTFLASLDADPSHHRLLETISQGLDPFLVDEPERGRVRWTRTGGQGPHYYGYRKE
jgi:hypothetical protein